MKLNAKTGIRSMTLAAFLAAFAGVTAYALPEKTPVIISSGICGPQVSWTFDSQGLLKISGKGPMYDFSDADSYIPGNLEIDQIIIEPGVTTVGDNFMSDIRTSDREIDSVALPSTIVEIGEKAFYSKYVSAIDLPNSIEKIEDYAFWDCNGWESNIVDGEIEFPCKLKNLGDFSFGTELSHPRTLKIILPEGLTEVGTGTFKNRIGLTVEFPDTIQKLGEQNNIQEYQYYRSKLVQEAAVKAGVHCVRLTCDHEQDIDINGPISNLTNVSGTVDLDVHTPTGGGKLSFESSNSKIATVSENGVLTILKKGTVKITIHADASSKYKEETETITLNIKPAPKGTVFEKNGVKYKITNASSGYTVNVSSLADRTVETLLFQKSIKAGGITYKITGIANNAFKNCTKLKSVTIGSNVTSIGKNAFYGDKALVNLVIKSKKINTVGKKALYGINKNAQITVPKEKYKKYKKLLKDKGQADSVAIIK